MRNREPATLARVGPNMADDFLGGIFALRRVIRHGTELEIAAVRTEMKHLDRMARREERRIARGRADAAAA